MNIVVSSTEQLKFGYSLKSILFVCFIKAIFPPINYDDEPSVSKGIMSQLPSSHLFIHRVQAKLLNSVYSLRKKPMPATALIFHLIVTDRASHAPVLIDSVDAIPLQALYGLCADVVLSDSIVYGFLIQNPAQPLILSEVRQGSGINSLYCRLPRIMRLPE